MNGPRVEAGAMATETAIRRVTVILNPASGRGQGRARRVEIERLLADAAHRIGPDAAWSIVETTAPGSATAQAAEAAKRGAEVVAAAGGDGTYGDVVNGLVGTAARLGIVPLGTGNDFARSFGLVGDLPTAIDALFNGEPRPIDLGISEFGIRISECNSPGEGGGPVGSDASNACVNPRSAVRTPKSPRWFINVAGCGFDAVVAERVNRGYRRLHGAAAYVAGVLQSLVRFRAAAMRITIDGEVHEVRAMLCSIANSRTYGGGMIIAPDAKIDDGWFDLCILRDAGKVEFIRAFPRVFKGTHVTHPKVVVMRGKRIRVESDPILPVLVDGEVVGVTPAEFEMRHHAIEVMSPRR